MESRNVTWVSDGPPVFWEEARGSNVRDVDGNEYLDLAGAFGVAFAGHAHRRVRAAVAEQSDRLIHGMGDVHPPEPKLELLERLAPLAPWAEARTVLASAGSEAVEIALKTTLLATGRPGVLAFSGGYHGLTLGALSATDRELFRAPFTARLYGGVARAPFPTARDGETALAEALDAVEARLAEGAEGDPIGAVILEPVQGRAGVRVPAPGFVAGVAERARAAGALLVCDEVMTGFGRTGRLFGHAHEGVVPDLLCVGKALGGGMPLSACMGPAEVMDAWPASEGEAVHTSTFLGHPVACAAGIAFLDAVAEEGLVERAEAKGAVILKGLGRGLAGVPGVVEVRGRGLMIGIELAGEAGAAARVTERALRAGLILLPAGERSQVVELAPPAVLTEAQIDHAIDGVTEVVRRWAEAS